MIVAADRVERLALMLPLSKLLEYREDLRDLVPLGPIGPDGHRTLRALLAGVSLTDPESVYQIAVGNPLLELPTSDILPDRDRAYGLARHIAEGLLPKGSDEALSALARLCYQVASEVSDPEVSKSLRDWVGQHVGGVANSTPASWATKTSFRVSVRLDHSGEGAQKMLLRVVIHQPGGLATDLFNQRISANQVQSTVEDLLPRIINEHVPPNAELAVEFVLPRGWLSKPVDEWTLGRSKIQVGWEHPVVVRDLARSKQNTHERQLARRWTELTATAVDAMAVYWVRCRDAVTERQLAASLAATARRGVLALVNPPVRVGSNPVLKAGLDSGIPVMLWRRIPCQDHVQNLDVTPCQGDMFQRDISAELAKSPIGELPELIRQLRVAAEVAHENEAHVGKALTLLWDPPELPTHATAPLALASRKLAS
jgi:hypothetical protein